MKKQFVRKVFSFLLLLGLFTPVSMMAQVTIGSAYEPQEGSLLDLKEKEDATGGENSTKGLLLPRVELKTIKPVVGKLSESIGNTGLWTEDIHTGLLVYNTVNTLDACTGGAPVGVYVWTGNEWFPVYQKKATVSTTDVSTDVYKGANSYVVATNSTVTIPVERAFNIWTDFTGATVSTGKVLDKATDVAGLSGVLTANVVWQDAGTISAATISGTGSAANLIVNTGLNQGNALVQVLIAGKVLWQWHIWVSNNNPLMDAQVYRVDGVDNWYMGRLLGATTSTDTGLYYQWGRNVPMQKTGDIATINASATEKDNLTNAIQSEKFIKFESTISHDWYSSTAKQWDNRWTSTGSTAGKSPFDPCPYGWRVPSKSTTEDLWTCIDNSSNTQNDFLINVLTGYRSNGNGSLGDVGTAGYVWTADANGKMATMLYYKGSVKNNADAFNRANAMNVRCIKEK